ncbi:MAG: CocE/NonD family hydrolase [Bacteroidia bacterium]
MKNSKYYIVICALVSVVLLTAGGEKHGNAEKQSSATPAPYTYRKKGKDRDVKISSQYLTMRDGTKIAASIYLPANRKKGEKLPVIFHQTRYWRSIDLRWPLSAIKSKFVDGYARMIKQIVLNGYAVVNIDVRGTGASFGCQRDPFSIEQIKDAEEVVSWIAAQEWSDGNVGLLGASYTGMSAEFSLANKHPNVKALMSLYTGLDFYDEMVFPGGVYQQAFIKKFGDVCAMLDRNEFTIGSKLENFFIKGVTPVQGHKKLLKQAVAEHQTNFNVYEQTRTVTYRNDESPDHNIQSVDELSLHSYLKEINESKVPICLFTGWFDGNFSLGSARLFNNLNGNKHKLIIGPWDHGSLYNCSPYIQQPCTFDRVAEVLKFFDYHLKGKQNGLYDEAPVHYYTMVEEQWKGSAVWPPIGPVEQSFYFSSDNTLVTRPVENQGGFDTYILDTTAGTGYNTRSESLVFMLTSSDMYDSRTERDKKLLCYNTQKLQADMEVTGHPIVTLYIDSDASDAAFFVYLEDVDEAGIVHYITEGTFRAIHRNSKGENGYKDVVPPYTYLKNAAAPLKPGEVAKLEFDLLPVSYLFKKGHSIRVAISCSESDHYKQVAPAGTKIRMHRNKIYGSKIVLPVNEAAAVVK